MTFTRNPITLTSPNKNVPRPKMSSANGTFQPPRNSVVASIETVNMLMYSARKNSANFIALYSV